uniref:Bromodomain-containing protein 8 n=1 Tax=Salarias fasciatus TaxID=181472 RepID=A0A672GZN3_SALFA
MANGVGKHKLLVIGPTEPWSVKEKLCLATSVMKSGDQNWVSVSRAIKPFAEPGRPPDWFSQKHCASKYSELLETTEAPKRKRGEKGEVVETVEDVIVRRLTAERIEELKKLIKETQENHRKLKKEAALIQAGHLDSKLEELWDEILQKKKQEEEEAELRRKNTDAAYQGISLHIMSASVCLQASGTARLMTFAEPAASGGEDGGHGSLLDDPAQKKLLGQKATPPPSPLLSELLKKGNILATNSRLVRGVNRGAVRASGTQICIISAALRLLWDGCPSDLSALCTVCCGTGAPMLSRLLEAGPSQFSSPLGFMVGAADSASSVPLSAATPGPVDSAASAHTGPCTVSHPLIQSPHAPSVASLLKTCDMLLLRCAGVDGMGPSVAPGSLPVSTQDKVPELSEDDVTVSYMGDELDLKTVGDIIAIIEDKADEAAEALDAAAVEAALSLCEENGHALSGAWDAGPFRPHDSHSTAPTGAPQSSALDGRTEASLSSLCNTQDNCLATFPIGLRRLPSTSSSPCGSKALKQCDSEAPSQSEAVKETGGVKANIMLVIAVLKCRVRSSHSAPALCALFEPLRVCCSPSLQKTKTEVRNGDGEGENASGTKAGNEVNEPEGEEDGDGVEEFLSEPDGELEPAASESEDGYSLHTASSSLQLHTTADSIASSPASSQFSVCSEDLEALQAQKIWKKAIMLVWRAAANHRYANVFLQPVTEEIAPGYHSIVHRPMDLATIKKNIETGLIRTTAEFQRDIMLMFQNAVMYNSLDHDVYHMALEMQRDVLEQLQQFLATQLIMETSESGISAKSLRGRESTRKQDSTDKVLH